MYMEGKIKEILISVAQPFCYELKIELFKENLSVKDSKNLDYQKTLYLTEFTLCSEFINALPQEIAKELLSSTKFTHIVKGERFIRQGDEAEIFYIILKGSC